MAWDHNARNRSAEVRRVNYHEDGPSKRKTTSSGGNRNSGGDGPGLGPVGKVILGGVAIYIAGQIGLGWVMDVKDKIDTAKEIKEAAKAVEKDAKASSKAEKKLKDDLTSGGYTVKFDIEENELEAGDVADILDSMTEVLEYFEDDSIFDNYHKVYLSTEVLENSANYQYAINKRLDQFNAEPVVFMITYSDISEKKMDQYWENAITMRSNNNLEYRGQYGYTTTYLKGMMGVPNNEDLTVYLAFYNEDANPEMQEVMEEAGETGE